MPWVPLHSGNTRTSAPVASASRQYVAGSSLNPCALPRGRHQNLKATARKARLQAFPNADRDIDPFVIKSHPNPNLMMIVRGEDDQRPATGELTRAPRQCGPEGLDYCVALVGLAFGFPGGVVSTFLLLKPSSCRNLKCSAK
jgi:hypothetical protein